jgi:hypothetical protein
VRKGMQNDFTEGIKEKCRTEKKHCCYEEERCMRGETLCAGVEAQKNKRKLSRGC